MENKIIVLSFLLIIAVAVTATYIVVNQGPSVELGDSFDEEGNEISEDEIIDELDETFESEDYEIDLGDMF